MSDTKTSSWIFFFLAMLFYFLIPGINHGLWSPDEPRVAATCSEMARDHDYVVPHLNGKPFLEKPPLYYAIGAVAGSLLGLESDVPYRLVSLMFGLLTIIVTFFMASKADGSILGIMSAGILASAWSFFELSRWIQVDIALVLGVTLGMYAYISMQKNYHIKYSIILGISSGIAFMAKGLVGPAIIAAAILTDMIRLKDLRIAWKIRPFTIAICTFLTILPWIIALYNRGGWPFLRVVLVVNNLMRFTGAPEVADLGHQQGALYYIVRFPGDYVPWIILFIPALIYSFKNFRHDKYISWFIGPFIILTIASTKRGVYLIPLYPAAACITAAWLYKASHAKWEDVLIKILWAVSIVACFAPFAGIFFGLPVLGAITGLISVSLLAIIYRMDMRNFKPVSLVMITCVAMFSVSVIYFEYRKPQKDYLTFTRQIVTAANGKEIYLLELEEKPEEIIRGSLYFVTGTIHKEIRPASIVSDEGMYFWRDIDDKILNTLIPRAHVQVLLEMDLDKHFKKKNKTSRIILRFAQVVPYPRNKG
jgi:4-amino-4-deoxy-L-arabinose transferase-like glycosyltransferase